MTLDVEHWNLDARLLPADDTDEAPAIELGGITVLAFLDGEEDMVRLAIQVIVDDVDPELRRLLDDDELPINVEVLGRQCVDAARMQLVPHVE